MAKPITGYVYWTVDKKPIRSSDFPETVKDIRGEEKIKHFWAFPIWNYKAQKLQIYEITQVTIQKPIMDLLNSEDWGDPEGFDITVSKSGKDLETEYSVQPHPHKAPPIEAVVALKKSRLNLDALYQGGDPFSTEITSEEVLDNSSL